MNQLIAWGLVLGSIMILGAIGLTMSVQIARFFNFAHGDLMTLGAYIAFLVSGLLAGAEFLQRGIGPFSFGWGLLLSFIPAILVTAAVAILFDRWVYRPLRERKALASYSDMASMGLAFLLRGLIYVVWGADYHFYFKGIRATVNLPLGIRLRTDELFIMAVAWALVAVFYLFLTRTKTGKALRAVADNPDLARVAGISTEGMITWMWGISGALCAIAGILYGIETQLRPEMGWLFLLPLFVTILLGGIGSITGALVGGLVLGVVQQVSTRWLLPTYKPAVAFLVMVFLLLLKPEGLFGRR